MRRILAIAGATLGLGLLVALPAASGGDDGPYLIRAVFDTGAFVVPGEEVRVAGARVGTVESVSVSMGDEVTSKDGSKLEGKAIVVLSIEDDGFKDFREDASCRIRPQSLLGEKYVDCTPTQPHAGLAAAPELEQIPDGEPGAGQRLLPVESNGTSVDLDLVQDINKLPYRERFRLIINELGAGVAGRGEDLGEVIDRANPALQQTDRVLAILAAQNRQLADLASNGDTVLQPLANERQHITGFMANATIAGQATAERGAALQSGLHKLPRTLHELRLTMKDLRGLTDNATPVLANTGAVAKQIARATINLAPFARAGIPALQSLGDAGQAAGPKIVAADPLTVDLTKAAVNTAPIAQNLKGILRTFEQTNGIPSLLRFVRFATTAQSGFDNFGHFLRTNVLVTSCIDTQYQPGSLGGCVNNFSPASASAAAVKALKSETKTGISETVEPDTTTPLPELLPPDTTTPDTTTPDSTTPDTTTPDQSTPQDSSAGGGAPQASQPEGASASAATKKRQRRLRAKALRAGLRSTDMQSTATLLDFLLGAP